MSPRVDSAATSKGLGRALAESTQLSGARTGDVPGRGDATQGLWTETRGQGIRVVFLHGFTQTAQSWDPVVQALAAFKASKTLGASAASGALGALGASAASAALSPLDALDAVHAVDAVDAVRDSPYEVVLPDLPGHGRSADVAINLETTAELVAKSFGSAIYVGYSMGGRVALHIARAYPELVRGLLLFGATPGLKTEAERLERRTADELLAQELESIGVPTFLDRWLRNPLFATLPVNPRDLQLRQQNTVAGLASSLRLNGTGSQESLWDSLHTISAPTIVAAGDRDHKFTALGEAMAHSIGSNAAFVSVTDSGHPCHLEQPHQAAQLLDKIVGQI